MRNFILYFLKLRERVSRGAGELARSLSVNTGSDDSNTRSVLPHEQVSSPEEIEKLGWRGVIYTDAD